MEMKIENDPFMIEEAEHQIKRILTLLEMAATVAKESEDIEIIEKAMGRAEAELKGIKKILAEGKKVEFLSEEVSKEEVKAIKVLEEMAERLKELDSIAEEKIQGEFNAESLKRFKNELKKDDEKLKKDISLLVNLEKKEIGHISEAYGNSIPPHLEGLLGEEKQATKILAKFIEEINKIVEEIEKSNSWAETNPHGKSRQEMLVDLTKRAYYIVRKLYNLHKLKESPHR
jgi:hypothetical protein